MHEDCTIAVDHFGSPTEVLKAASSRPVNESWQGMDRESDQRGSWGSVNSFDEAMEKAKEGFSEITEEMKMKYETSKAYVFERIKPRQVMPVNAYVGSTPNVVRAMMGLPKDMRRVKAEPRKAPGIQLTYEIGLNCGFSDETLKERGARMLVLVSLFALHNIPVKLTISDSHTGLRKDRNEICMYEYDIQDYGESMNIRKVSYWLAHPSVHRRISFAITETSPTVERYSCGYGYPIANDEETCNTVKESFKRMNKGIFLTPRDFLEDEDIIKVWNEITGNEDGDGEDN